MTFFGGQKTKNENNSTLHFFSSPEYSEEVEISERMFDDTEFCNVLPLKIVLRYQNVDKNRIDLVTFSKMIKNSF